MPKEYSITYKTENTYDNWVNEAHWQFLITPIENESQHEVIIDFSNTVNSAIEYSINGYGFNTIRVHPRERFKEISFEANFRFVKDFIDPFNFQLAIDDSLAYQKLEELNFKIDFDIYLKDTQLTQLPNNIGSIFEMSKSYSIFTNLQNLMNWIHSHIEFKTGVTKVDTPLMNIISNKQGVCQDFTHLFCAMARRNGIPCRYVSGYLNQDQGYTGDSQMHAWAEAYIPFIGWKGFDPTNNILANTNHIKVCHGKDYKDCAPLKGIIYSQGENQTKYSVKVQSQQ